MSHAYTPRERRTAIVYGILCHGAFAVGIAAMIAGIFTGLRLGHGPFSGASALGWDLLLVAQFAVLHSFLLTQRGRAVIARLAPAGLGAPLSTTTFALISSLQLILTFTAWSRLGDVWWEPHGWLRSDDHRRVRSVVDLLADDDERRGHGGADRISRLERRSARARAAVRGLSRARHVSRGSSAGLPRVRVYAVDRAGVDTRSFLARRELDGTTACLTALEGAPLPRLLR